MKKLLLLNLMCAMLSVRAQQSQGIVSFIAMPGKTDITLVWSINGNAGCSGPILLEYANDSLFSFPTTIYTMTAPPSTSVLTYQYTHTTADLTKKNYYRLTACGTSVVTSGNVGSALNYQLYPNPFREQAMIIFQNPANLPVNMYIFDHNGQLVRKTNVFQGNVYQLERGGLYAGLYYFAIATNNDLVTWGKFYVTDF